MEDIGKSTEYLFASKCMEYGIAINFPCSERLPYDFLTDYNGRLSRVQVKSAFKDSVQLRYRAKILKNNGDSYTDAEVDTIAVYVREAQVWYIIPIDELYTDHLSLRPDDLGKCKQKAFYENWEELK